MGQEVIGSWSVCVIIDTQLCWVSGHICARQMARVMKHLASAAAQLFNPRSHPSRSTWASRLQPGIIAILSTNWSWGKSKWAGFSYHAFWVFTTKSTFRPQATVAIHTHCLLYTGGRGWHTHTHSHTLMTQRQGGVWGSVSCPKLLPHVSCRKLREPRPPS